MSRREYDINIVFNRVQINKVIIDLHFEKKHSASMNDEIILALVQQLDDLIVAPEEIDPPYSYFIQDKMEFNGKRYKLVWLTEEDEIFIGVLNAYRR
jgi:hypothetical protein